jgi:hypothetical protein
MAVAGLLAYGAWRAQGALLEAQKLLPGLEAQLRTDPEGADEQLATLQAHTRTARSATAGPLWSVAGHLPFFGDDLVALRTISETVDRLALDVLPRMASAVQAVTPATLAPVDGRIDLAPIQDVKADVVAADYAVGSSIEALSRVNRAGLIAPLAQAANSLQTQLVQARGTTATAVRAVELIPGLLGVDGPRSWLLLAQNVAEPRPGGGHIGTVVEITADNGAIEFGETIDGMEVGPFDLPIYQQESEIFGRPLGALLANATLTPDFPRSATLATQMWGQAQGSEMQGAVALDPVVLQSIVEVTGPVTFDFDASEVLGVPTPVESITLTGSNTASFLLSEVYSRFARPRVQDEVFAQAARAVFERLMDGNVDASRLVDVFIDAAAEGRVMVWSAVPQEQALIEGTIISGQWRGSAYATVGSTELSPVVGVFVNTFYATKLGYYLDKQIEVTDVETRADGSQTFTVNVSLTNTLDPAAVSSLPSYVLGGSPAEGTIGVNVYFSSPTGGAIRSVHDSTGGEISVAQNPYNDMIVAASYAYIQPGETVSASFEVASGRNQPGPILVRQTPLARS